MRKLFAALFMLAVFSAPAQNLFTYGNESVSADDFIKAFKKNNNGAKDEKALKEYLDLYIASRLKIKEAKEKRFDTLPQLITDLANLRQQILPTYLNDKESLNQLVTQAFNRSQKDIHVAHIFIAFTRRGIPDSIAAAKKKDQVIDKLKKGVKFEDVAREYSDDPAAKSNGGNLGWLTVFTLPYELENVVYATPVSKFSQVYRSKAGYHIFKNNGERKAIGRMKAAQILLAFPPGITAGEKAILRKRADSLYNRLQAGDDFGKLATAFSNDIISSASNGQMSEFGAGEYDPVFENTVFSLPKDGAISKPFETAHGYHIVKRIKLIPVAMKLNAAETEALTKRIEANDRILTTKAALAQKVMKEAGFKRFSFSESDLWIYSDSVLGYLPPKKTLTINPGTELLKIGSRTITTKDWLTYAQTFRYKPDGNGVKPFPQLWDEFVQATALQYYQDHLESFNDDFRRQVTEFAEGNLFFEIMQRQVWTPAQTDTLALTTYYQKHKNNYNWKQSADAVIFYAANAETGKEFYKALTKAPAAWRTALS
ncbi:MAG: peptidylprolyl isomerase, partial [Bacteroidota bacterium]|nr:peptidylprolyl isomerase [Bacteroidota bacterium]